MLRPYHFDLGVSFCDTEHMSEPTTYEKVEQAGYVMFCDLVQRGWTDHLKRKFLGKPENMICLDIRKERPEAYGNPQVGVWSLARVLEIEATPEWQKAFEKAQRRKQTWHEPQRFAGPRVISRDFTWALNTGWIPERK